MKTKLYRSAGDGRLFKLFPILFKTPMVQAILGDHKTQTRRTNYWLSKHFTQTGFILNDVRPIKGYVHAVFRWTKDPQDSSLSMNKCPYGEIGDVLWVRETLYLDKMNVWHYKADDKPVCVRASDELEMLVWAHHKETDYCSSIHMPKFAARLFLKITSIRLERLHEISERDAIAEGVNRWASPLHPGAIEYQDYSVKGNGLDPRDIGFVTASASYMSLWQKINGRDSWHMNPYTWVVDFEKTRQPVEIDQTSYAVIQS